MRFDGKLKLKCSYIGSSSNSLNLLRGQRRRAVAGWLNPRELLALCLVIGGLRVSFSGLNGMYASAVYLMLPVSSCRAESAVEASYAYMALFIILLKSIQSLTFATNSASNGGSSTNRNKTGSNVGTRSMIAWNISYSSSVAL